MIDGDHVAASLFLWLAGGAFLLVFALPLLLAPMRWAAWFRWRIPEENDLAVYLGRCLGAVALALVTACLACASHPADHPRLFELLSLAGALLCLAHVPGAVSGRQPWTETAEIPMYAALSLLAGGLRLGL